MKKVLMVIKILITAVLIISGLVIFTNWKLNGFTFFDMNVAPETVEAFMDTFGSYFFWIYVVLIVLMIWGIKLKK